MAKNSPFSSMRMHLVLAAGALLVLLASVGTGETYVASFPDAPKRVVDVAIEHTESVAVTFEMSMLDGQSIIDVRHDGHENVAISVPVQWKRREVRNVPLRDVTQDEPMFGYARWNVPANATVSFEVAKSPDNILIHNPSELPLSVRYVKVDLETDEVVQDAILLTNKAGLLW